MKIEINVPAMGESISEATIGEIIVQSGSKVEVDQEIVELETDKVNQVLYAPESGILNLTVKMDDTVKIGQTIGYIDKGGKEEQKKEKKVEPAASSEEPSVEKKEETQEREIKPVEDSGVRITPENFLDELKGRETILSDLPVKEKPLQQRETRHRMSKIRKVIANRLVEAQHTAAMLTTFNEVDMSAVIQLREKYKEPFFDKFGVKLGFMSFFVKASVYALQEIPEVNSYIDGDQIVERHYYNIGIAVGTERGLVVPVVKDCDILSFDEIEKNIGAFAEQARGKTLSVDDLQGGGFTITNGGIYGSLLSTPILNPPQCGILGMHKIQKRAIVEEDQIVIKPMMYLALSYDHRIVDGKEAVNFLVHVKNMLEDPSRFLLGV